MPVRSTADVEDIPETHFLMTECYDILGAGGFRFVASDGEDAPVVAVRRRDVAAPAPPLAAGSADVANLRQSAVQRGMLAPKRSRWDERE